MSSSCACAARSGLQSIGEGSIVVGEERVFSKTVIWNSGVAPSPAGKWLGSALNRARRVRVQPDMTIAKFPEIFVIEDTASVEQPDGCPLSCVAQVAMQQGANAAKARPV